MADTDRAERPVAAIVEIRLNLGVCSACQRSADETALHVHPLPYRCAVPGRGWGCALCGTPCDGAFAVFCPACCRAGRAPVVVPRGDPTVDGVMLYADLHQRYEHDEQEHRRRAWRRSPLWERRN